MKERISGLLNKLTPREKKILIFVGVLLAMVGSYHGVLHPLLAKISNMDEEISAMEMKLRKAHVFAGQSREILEEAKKHSTLNQMQAGTDEEETAKLLNLIEKTARKTGATLADMKPKPVTADKMFKRYGVELNADLKLEELISFLYELEHSSQLLNIEQIILSPREDNAQRLRAFILVTRVVVK